MAIYFGDRGQVEITRQAGAEALTTTLVADDVNVGAKRFSVVFMAGAITTGDYITIKRTQLNSANEVNLRLVAGHNFPDWSGFINVDAIGGVRLYRTFEDALDGKKSRAIDLERPNSDQDITIESQDLDSRCVAEVRSFEINTTRETIDSTSLSNEFRNSLKNGLISGQGRLECFWEHKREMCEGQQRGVEFNAYLAKLCIRLQQGSGFGGIFYIYYSENSRSVWYDAQCAVTNVSISVAPGQIIETTIDFITTGPVQLKTGFVPSTLLQESNAFILDEGGRPQQIDYSEDD